MPITPIPGACYLVIGMFLETLSMMVATVPVITPIIIDLGFDPVWFGTLIMLLTETAMITPPIARGAGRAGAW